MNRTLLSCSLLAFLMLGVPALAWSAPAGSLVAVGWLNDLYYEFQKLVTTRRGMMVFSTLGVALALYVIWYRRN